MDIPKKYLKQTVMLFLNTTLSELVMYRRPRNSSQYSFKEASYLSTFCIAILSLEQILEGSPHLSLRLLVILLHPLLHAKSILFPLNNCCNRSNT